MANSTDKLTKLQELVTQVRESKLSDFYGQIWRGKDGKVDLRKLPVCTESNFIDTPPSDRRYFTGKGITRIVGKKKSFLVERTLRDLFEEDYGDVTCRKPLVLFKDPREAIEKSLWFYEHNILPLIGESGNLPVAVHSAREYGIDALVTETSMLDDFISSFEKKSGLSNIKSVTLINDYFSKDVVFQLVESFVNVKLVLALPETGSIAVSCNEKLHAGELIFHETNGSIIEIGEKAVISKTVMMPTPIIRYETNLHLMPSTGGRCSCDKKELVLGS